MTAGSLPSVLVFAGLDPSGGAGIAADILAIAAQGAHALPLVTALTVQDNDRVFEVAPVDTGLLWRQARALTGKIMLKAVKVGIPGSAANAQMIAELVIELRRDQPGLPLVLDPVLASGHGDLLSVGDALAALVPLLPLVTLILPNGPEAQRLTGETLAREQARMLLAAGCRHVLITGGHADGGAVVNRWFSANAEQEWSWPRLAGQFHGSGQRAAGARASDG
jgi:hydroxymethylpyrimidine/phosphomethylpyrimidine kinase